MTAHRVTQADVARAAGTSTAVVSYVINNGPRPVSEETRKRVLAAIEEVGYRPDPIAQALASGESGTFGLIVPDITNAFFAELARRFEEAASDSGKVILLGDAGERIDREAALIDAFVGRRVDGIVIATVDEVPDTRRTRGIPVVVLDRGEGDSEFSSISIDNIGAAYDATTHLIDAHGYRSIGMIAGLSRKRTSNERVKGWSAALSEHGIAPGVVIEAPFSRDGGLDAGRRLLTGERPRAVFVASEAQAIGVLAACAEAGVRVPDDLAVITIDGTQSAEFAVPQLSCIVQPLDELAVRAVRQLQAGADQARHERCGHDLRVRGSCGTHPT